MWKGSLGTIQPFNRKYMETSASPLQKMSFETTAAFLQQALLAGQPVLQSFVFNVNCWHGLFLLLRLRFGLFSQRAE